MLSFRGDINIRSSRTQKQVENYSAEKNLRIVAHGADVGELLTLLDSDPREAPDAGDGTIQPR